MRFEDIKNHSQKLKALTSYDVDKFYQILPYFQAELEDYFENYTFEGKKRTRKYVPKAPEQLSSVEEKLFFVLYYLKNNPTQEALGFTFGLSQDMCNKWIHLLTNILQKSLKSYEAESNPYRIANKIEENQSYIVDGTERPIQRDSYVQEEYFSGKKNPIQ
jgi:hypothetical protein